MSTDHLHQPAGDGHTGRNDASDRIFEAYLIEALGGDAAPDQRRRILEQAAQRGLLGGDGAGLSGTREPGDEDPDPHTPMNTISRHDARTRRSLYSVATAAVLLLAVALIVMIATSTRSTPDSSNTVAVQPGPTDPRPTDPRPTDPPTGPDMANDPTEWPTYESYDIGVTPEVAAIKGDVVDATNAMGLDLLVRLREQDRDRNTMISPLSIGMVMHMLLNGATGTTAEEMRAALRLKDLPLDAVNVSNQMQKAIEERVRSKSTVRISNSLWANPEMQLERAFADTLHDSYGARVSPLESAAPINEWVNQ
ncbi:MAG: serpin family protein, partial [Planctomycetota bacterium]